MRYFVRILGQLTEVRPLTKPHRGQSLVLCESTRDGQLLHIEARDLIASY